MSVFFMWALIVPDGPDERKLTPFLKANLAKLRESLFCMLNPIYTRNYAIIDAQMNK
jgi:hypothetical protein